MAFYIYETQMDENRQHINFKQLREIQLAGYNTIYKLWSKKQKPVDIGWHINKDELISELEPQNFATKNYSIICDLHPKATWRIALYEIKEMFIYTYGYGAPKPSWSVLMLKLNVIYYDEFEKKKLDEIDKTKQNFELAIKEYENQDDIFEFLYLGGQDRGWNWGTLGRVNGALIDKIARNYFKTYFCQ